MARRRGNNEGMFRRRSNGLWEYRVSVGQDAEGKHFTKSFYGKTKGDCSAKFEDFIKNNRVVIKKEMRLGEWADRWLEVYKMSGKTGTINHYRSLIEKYIKPSPIGGMKLDNIRPAQVQLLLNDCAHMSFSHQTKLKATLWSIFSTAIDNDLCRKNPCNAVKIKPPGVTKLKEDEYFTVEECQRISNYCMANTSVMSRAVMIFLHTGMRRGELLGLQWGDISGNKLNIRRVAYLDGGKKALEDTTKTSAGIRSLIVLPVLLEVLSTAKRDSLFIIPDKNGNFYDPNHFSRAYNRFIAEIEGVRPLRTHAYRHAMATHLHALGVDIRTIQSILGHSDIQTTGNVYTAVDIRLIEDAMSRLPY